MQQWRMIVGLMTLVLFAATSLAQESEASLSGRVVDFDNEPVAGTMVMVCDNATGMPLGKDSFAPYFSGDSQRNGFEDILFTTTDKEGRFAFPMLPKGTYKLVAQSWDETPDGPELHEVNGLHVRLRGMKRDIAVPSDDANNITLSPLGKGTLVWHRGASNDDWYIVVSTRSVSADPVLGFIGWPGPFVEHAIAFNRMPHGETVFHGLPEGTVTWTVFANDSNPGFGAGKGRIIRGHQEVIVAEPDVVSMWSDGRADPPEHLAALTDHVEQLMNDGGVERVWNLLAGEDKPMPSNPRNIMSIIEAIGPMDRVVDLGDDVKATVGDVMAASAYASFRRGR